VGFDDARRTVVDERVRADGTNPSPWLAKAPIGASASEEASGLPYGVGFGDERRAVVDEGRYGFGRPRQNVGSNVTVAPSATVTELLEVAVNFGAV
jgi:hypothetical protein